jgi:hypothetical protein
LKMLRFMLSLSCYSPWRRTYVCLQVSPLSVEIKPSPTHDEMLMLMLAGNQQSTRVAGHGKEIGVCIKPGPKARSFTIQRSISQWPKGKMRKSNLKQPISISLFFFYLFFFFFVCVRGGNYKSTRYPGIYT